MSKQPSKVAALRQQVGDTGEAPDGYLTWTTRQCEKFLAERNAQVEAPAADKPADPVRVPSMASEKKARAERELDAFIAEFPGKVEDLDLSTVEGRATAKRRLAAHKAIATMRREGKLPAASEKAPVDPILSARAKQAWETRRARIADAQASQS